MFITKPNGLAFTLVFALTIVLALATASEAKGYEADSLRRDHGTVKRLIRKRSPANLAVVSDPVIVASPNPPADTARPSPTTPASQPTASVAPVDDTPTSAPAIPSVIAPVPVASAPPSAAASTPLLASIINPLTATPTAVAVSTSLAAATSSILPVPSITTSSSTPVVTPTVSAPLVTAPVGKTTAKGVVTLTSQVSAASSTATGVPARNAQMQKTVTTVIIVIASVVGGTAVIWTIIRKWKFSPSNSFEDRMQPIDWQPTNEDTGLPPARRLSNASSFHSAGHGENMSGYGVGGGYGSTSDYGHGGYGSTSDHGQSVAPLQPLPDHDFTAAPATHLAPVGGYADLARGPSRGPSPGPPMQEAYRGPVGYHTYGVSQDAYDYNGVTRY